MIIRSQTYKSYKFIDTKRFSPVIYGNDKPFDEDYFHIDPKKISKAFLKELDYIIDTEWWEKQYDRCINGHTVYNALVEGGDAYTNEPLCFTSEDNETCLYGDNIIVDGNDVYFKDLNITIKNGNVHIPGRMYFYLNFWNIHRVNDAGIRKEMANPLFTDLSFENWMIRERMRKEKKNNMWSKSRQKGYSEEEACDTAYDFLFYNGSQGIILGGEDKYNDNTMSMVRNGIDLLRNTQFYKELDKGGDSEEEIRTKNTGAQVFSFTIKNNTQAASGKTPSKVHCEEIGIWKKGYVKDVTEIVNPSIESIGIKTGYIVYTGCVCAGTKVFANNGELKNIEDLKKEDGIIGYSNKGISFESISHFNPPQKKMCYRIETQYGRILECSDDHPILWSKTGLRYNERIYSNRERISKKTVQRVLFKETQYINSGDHIMIIESVPLFGNKHMWNPRLVGMLIGDGSYGIDKTPIISNCDNEINNYVESNFDTSIELNKITKTNKIYKEIRIRNICQNLRELGIYGQTKTKKELPINLHLYNEHSLLEMIGGLYDTDGCIVRTNVFGTNSYIIKITQLSYHVIEQLQYLLLRFGIHSNISKETPKIRDRYIKGSSVIWNLLISNNNGLKIFSQKIKLLVKYKQEVLNEINNTLKLVTQTEFVNTNTTHGKKSKLIYCEQIRSEKVKSIKCIGMQYVYNLTAENTHTYIANGIITHNTGGDMEDGVADMEKMCYNPEKFELLEFENRYENTDEKSMIARFVPSYRFSIIDKDGNSLCEESIKKFFNTLKLKDYEARYRYITMNPIKPSQIFTISSGGFFGKSISQRCNERKAYINSHRESKVCMRYRAEIKNGKDLYSGINMIPDESGSFIIAEHPVIDSKINKAYEGLYKAGTDSYDQDEAAYSKSKGACWIKKGFLNASTSYNKYVAGIIERPTEAEGGRELFYRNTMILCIYYNCLNLIEWSKILIFDYYHKNNGSVLLKLRPEFVSSNIIIDSRATNKYGIDPSTKIHWLTMHRTWLETEGNIEKCDIIELLDAWSKFKYDPTGKKFNCDNTIASSLCTVFEEDEKGIDSNQTETVSCRPIGYTMNSNGELISKRI